MSYGNFERNFEGSSGVFDKVASGTMVMDAGPLKMAAVMVAEAAAVISTAAEAEEES